MATQWTSEKGAFFFLACRKTFSEEALSIADLSGMGECLFAQSSGLHSPSALRSLLE